MTYHEPPIELLLWCQAQLNSLNARWETWNTGHNPYTIKYFCIRGIKAEVNFLTDQEFMKLGPQQAAFENSIREENLINNCWACRFILYDN